MSDQPPPDKGKGKASKSDAAPTTSNTITSMLASAARNAPSDIASLLSSQGKPQPGSSAGASLSRASAARDQLVDDVRGQSSTTRGAAASSFRSTTDDSTQEGSQSMRSFAAGPSPLDAPLSSLSLDDEALVGAYSTSSSLDEPMHRVVRQDSLSYLSRERPSQSQPGFEDAWRAAQPAQGGGDFMALLGADEDKEVRAVPASSTLPPGVTQEWTPPSPSNGTISLEQLELHRRLGALQDGIVEPGSELASGPSQIPPDLRTAYQPTSSDGRILSLPADLAQNALGSRAGEGIRPPDDDRERGEGVYAMDPVKALESVFGAGQSQAGVGEAQRRGRESADRVRERLGVSVARGSYVDDVYGLPPLLSSLIAEAEAPEASTPDPDTEAKREKAIRRLDALWRHLGGGAAPGPASAEAFLKSSGGN